MGFESGVEEKFQLMEAIFGKIVKLQCPTLSEGHWTLEKLDNIGFKNNKRRAKILHTKPAYLISSLGHTHRTKDRMYPQSARANCKE